MLRLGVLTGQAHEDGVRVRFGRCKSASKDQALAADRGEGFLGKRSRLAKNPDQRPGADSR